MANALQMRERCLAFETYGAYASRAEWRRGRIRRRTKRYCVWRQCSARGTRTEATTLQAEVFVRECIADTKKATAYAMAQKPHRNICGTTAWLTLAEGSVRSISPRKSLQRLEGTRHARHKRLPRKSRDVEPLSWPTFAHGSLKGIGKTGFKRR